MPTHLTAGTKAPAFSGMDQDGNKVSLADFKGKKVILYFYPEDDTPGCTTQACNLRDNEKALQKQGYAVIGVSPNDEASHKKFAEKYALSFPLIADPAHKIIEKYGVWGEKNLYGRKFMGLNRTTFIIDENGVIDRIILRPKTKIHAEEILATKNK
jgi:thioredoxin-dependent peroxiredoxin